MLTGARISFEIYNPEDKSLLKYESERDQNMDKVLQHASFTNENYKLV